MKTGTILRQGSSSVGRSPIGGEVFLWTGAFVAREVTVIAPLGMTKSERLKYYSELASFLKSQLLLAKVESTKLNQASMHFPYTLFASLYIYNKLYQEPGRTDLAFSDAFIWRQDIDNKIGNGYAGDLFLAYNTLQIRSANDIFWFKAVDRLNASREKRGVSPLLEFFSGPYLYERALVWNTIYDQFKIRDVYNISPPKLDPDVPAPTPLTLIDVQTSYVPDVTRIRAQPPNADGSAILSSTNPSTLTLDSPIGQRANSLSSARTNQGEQSCQTTSSDGSGESSSRHFPGPSQRGNSETSNEQGKGLKAAPPETSNQAKKVGTASRGKRARESTGSDGRTVQETVTQHREVGGKTGNKRNASSVNLNSMKKVSATNRPPTKKIRTTPSDPGVTTNATQSTNKGMSREHPTPTDAIKTVSRTGSHSSAITKPPNESRLKQQSIVAALGNVTVFVWDEFALVVPHNFSAQRPFIKGIFDVQVSPVACISCLRAGVICMVKLGSFHGCFFCKVNQRGCSLCPKINGPNGAPLNVPQQNWCWYLTLIHHIASILDLDQPEGPIALLPSYEGVQFPPFDQQLTKLIKSFKTTMTDDDIKAEWKQIKKNPPANYYGMPHQKLLDLGSNRPERGRFPRVGDGINVQRKLCSILRQAEEGTLGRLWAIGYNDERPRPGKDKITSTSKVTIDSWLDDRSESMGSARSPDRTQDLRYHKHKKNQVTRMAWLEDSPERTGTPDIEDDDGKGDEVDDDDDDDDDEQGDEVGEDDGQGDELGDDDDAEELDGEVDGEEVDDDEEDGEDTTDERAENNDPEDSDSDSGLDYHEDGSSSDHDSNQRTSKSIERLTDNSNPTEPREDNDIRAAVDVAVDTRTHPVECLNNRNLAEPDGHNDVRGGDLSKDAADIHIIQERLASLEVRLNRTDARVPQNNFQEQLNILTASLLALRQESAEQWASVSGLSQTVLHELRTLRAEDLVAQAALSTRVDLLAQNLNQLGICMNKMAKSPSLNAETWELNAETWNDCITALNQPNSQFLHSQIPQLMLPLPPTPLSAYSSPASQSLPPVVSSLPPTPSTIQNLLLTPASTYSSPVGQIVPSLLAEGTSKGKEDREVREEHPTALSAYSSPASQSLPPVVSSLPPAPSTIQNLVFTPTSTYSSDVGQIFPSLLAGGTSKQKEDREVREERPTALSVYSSPTSQSLPPVFSSLPPTPWTTENISATPASTYPSLFGHLLVPARLVGGTSDNKENPQLSPLQDNHMPLSPTPVCVRGTGDQFPPSQTEHSIAPAAADDSLDSQKEHSITPAADDDLT